MFDWYGMTRSALFRIDPETAHGITIQTLKAVDHLKIPRMALSNLMDRESPSLEREVANLHFKNPIGLAAGFDKNGEVTPAMAAFGFGFLEVGTVTPLPQKGNNRPRLFRYVEQESLVNRMGFNNKGMAQMRANLKERKAPVPVGINIGKNKATPLDKALEDYRLLIETLEGCCDYLTINLSSPNTPNLRDLQNVDFIKKLFDEIDTFTPIFLKIAPDLDSGPAIDLSQVAIECGAAGIIATNTSIDTDLLEGPVEQGGISGPVLQEKSFAMLEALAQELKGAVIISCGGIDSGYEAYRRFKAGASLVQIYTALVYHGPEIVKRIIKELEELLAEDGCSTLEEVIGQDL